MSNARNIADAGHQLVAWIKFDGTASIPSSGTNTIGILGSFNVSSIIEPTWGKHTVTINNSPNNTNYCVVTSCSAGGGNTDSAAFVTGNNTFDIYTYTSDSGNLNGSFSQISAVAYD